MILNQLGTLLETAPPSLNVSPEVPASIVHRGGNFDSLLHRARPGPVSYVRQRLEIWAYPSAFSQVSHAEYARYRYCSSKHATRPMCDAAAHFVHGESIRYRIFRTMKEEDEIDLNCS